MAERKYWNEEIETMPLDKLKKLQEGRLQARVTWAYERSAFCRRKLDEAGIKPADIKTLNDLQKLPFTTTEEFRKAPLSDRLAVPFEELKWIGSTSGTTGFPDIIPFTERDRGILLEEIEPRFRWALGVRPNDVIQILSGFECCLIGAPKVGATVLRGDAGRGNLDYQIRLAQMAGVTVLEHLPSLVLKYFERAKELGIDIKKSKLRMVIGVAEGWAEARKRKFEEEYGIVFRTAAYGSMEAGVAGSECEEGKGMHMFGELSLVEIIDPETLDVLGPGEEGEIVLTPLLNEAMPLIRYRTNDVGSILPYEPCPCGRTSSKIGMVKGRISHIIRVNGKKNPPYRYRGGGDWH